MFQNRKEAGKLLAEKLSMYAGEDTVILALPRGGVVIGAEIARALKAPLDIVVTRKIGHPDNPEYAVCAVDEKGTLLCNEVGRAAIDRPWLREETARQQKEAQRRATLYRAGKEPARLFGKIAILADDGIATGLTMRLAVVAVRAEHPTRIVVAVPVAPPDAVEQLRAEVDALVVLEPPEDFVGAVGAHYEHFEQVEDSEVVRLLSHFS